MINEDTMPVFFKRYYGSLRRHYFEHIHEDRPVRMYFDMEYPRELNRDFKWDEFWPRFQELVQQTYFPCQNLWATPPKFLVLDSTTPQKFSKHVIVHTQRLFYSNRSLKPLIDKLCEKMRQSNLGIIRSYQRNDDLIVDTGVYDRRRNFRMYMSSKFGKPAVLDMDYRCDFYGRGFNETIF